MELEGRVALITGGARRVGAAIARRLANAGVNVALHYRRSESDAQRTAAQCKQGSGGVDVALFQADFSDRDAVAGLVPRVRKRFGNLDILINNASIFERQTIDEFELGAWDRHLQVNLTAPMILAHAARDALRAAHGRIVNLCDVATARPWPDHLAYMVAKGGLDTLTRVLARVFAPEVNVIGIAPGVADWPEDYPEAVRERLLERIPLQRAGSPEDIAALVHFVLQGGDYITGAILPIDGGRSIR